jgi:hypothetical protein
MRLRGSVAPPACPTCLMRAIRVMAGSFPIRVHSCSFVVEIPNPRSSNIRGTKDEHEHEHEHEHESFLPSGFSHLPSTRREETELGFSVADAQASRVIQLEEGESSPAEGTCPDQADPVPFEVVRPPIVPGVEQGDLRIG